MCSVLNRKFHTSYDPISPGYLFQCVTFAKLAHLWFTGSSILLIKLLGGGGGGGGRRGGGGGEKGLPPPTHTHTRISVLNEQVYTNRFHEDQVILSCIFCHKIVSVLGNLS